jgi:m7GpppX diphosphatase
MRFAGLIGGRVYNILEGKKEADRVLYKEEHDEDGFIILPDLKWDQTSLSALVSTCPSED